MKAKHSISLSIPRSFCLEKVKANTIEINVPWTLKTWFIDEQFTTPKFQGDDSILLVGVMK